MTADILIIGGGAAGLGAARAARHAGADPVLVSDGPIGGDCTFTGCVPSKTLIADSRRGISFGDAIDRVHRTVERIAATESADVLRSEGIDVVEGRAVFTGPSTVRVGSTTISARRIVVATGARAAVPPVPGLESVSFLTNETLFDLSERPRRLGIVGAGPIGSEMAMAFAGFGTDVCLFEAAGRVLPAEEPEASAVIGRALGNAGVRVVTGSAVAGVEADRGPISVSIGGEDVEVDELLVAAGRRPNTSGLGLEDVGVTLDERGHVVVDDRLRTSVKGISAAGDVTGLLPFTHAADEQGRMAVAHALRSGPRWRYDTAATPWVTFTDPEVARVGMTESEAAACGGRVAHLPLDRVDRALTDGRTDGFVKLIAGPRRLARNLFGGRLLGATVVAARAGEMIHGPVIVARTGMFVGRLAQVMTAYPTWSNAIQQAAGQFFQEVSGLEARPARVVQETSPSPMR